MPALKPLTHRSLLTDFTGRRFNVPRTVRNNTQVLADMEGEQVVFEVTLHGSTIAKIRSDSVQVWAGKFRTATTRNRLNDVLLPLGYCISGAGGTWVVAPTDVELTEGDVVPFRDGMVINNK